MPNTSQPDTRPLIQDNVENRQLPNTNQENNAELQTLFSSELKRHQEEAEREHQQVLEPKRAEEQMRAEFNYD